MQLAEACPTMHCTLLVYNTEGFVNSDSVSVVESDWSLDLNQASLSLCSSLYIYVHYMYI